VALLLPMIPSLLFSLGHLIPPTPTPTQAHTTLPSPPSCNKPPHHHSNQSRLVIPSATLSALPVGTYRIQAAITGDFGGASVNAAVTLVVKASGKAPVISIVGPASRTFKIKDGFKITSTLVADSVCPGTEVSIASAFGMDAVR